MAVGIATQDKMCLVCGGSIRKGKTLVKFAPVVPNSERCANCYGKPDKFEPSKPATAPVKVDTSSTEVPDPYDDDVEVEELVQEKAEEEEQEPVNDDEPLAEEPEPADSESKSEGEGDGEGESQTPPPDDDPFQKMVDALTPPVSDNVTKAVLDKTHPVQKKLDDLNTKIQDAKDVFRQANEGMQTLESSLAKALARLEGAEAGKMVVDLSVVLPDAKTFKFEGIQHNQTPALLRLMNRRRNIYMHGPAGGGKSTAARKCAEALGIPYYYISLNPQSSPTRIEGYQTAHGEYVMTLFRKAYEFGGVFCADEADNAAANLWTSINNAIDSNIGSFPDGLVTRHKDFIFVGTGNTNLSGCAIYRDRKAQDKATISRFVFLRWPYDVKLEEAIVKSINPKGLVWMKWVHKLREFALVNNPQLFAYCTPRACIDGAHLISDGFAAETLADMVVFKDTFDSTAKGEALKKCPLPSIAA